MRNKERTTERVTLLMIMVPHLIDSPEDARAVHVRRMQERLDFLERYSAFKHRDLDLAIDYRRKSGLLGTINAAVRRQRDHDRDLALAQAELRHQPLQAEIDLEASATTGAHAVETDTTAASPTR